MLILWKPIFLLNLAALAGARTQSREILKRFRLFLDERDQSRLSENIQSRLFSEDPNFKFDRSTVHMLGGYPNNISTKNLIENIEASRRPKRASLPRPKKYLPGLKSMEHRVNLLAPAPKRTLLDPEYRRKLFDQLPLSTQEMFRRESEKNVFVSEPELRMLLPTYGKNQIPNNRDGSSPSKKVMFSVLLSSFHAYMEDKYNSSRPKRSPTDFRLVTETSPCKSRDYRFPYYFGGVFTNTIGCNSELEAHCGPDGNSYPCDLIVGRRRRSFDYLTRQRPGTLSIRSRVRRTARKLYLTCQDGSNKVNCDSYSLVCIALLKMGDCSCFKYSDPAFCSWFERNRSQMDWALAKLTTEQDEEVDTDMLDFYLSCAERNGFQNCRSILEVCSGFPFQDCLCSEVASYAGQRTKSMKCAIPSPEQRYEASLDMESQCERLGGKDCKRTYGSCMGVPFPDCMCKIDLRTKEIGKCTIFKPR